MKKHYPELVRLPNGPIANVKIDDNDLFVYAGTQYRVDRSEWVDTRLGYANPCEALGPP